MQSILFRVFFATFYTRGFGEIEAGIGSDFPPDERTVGVGQKTTDWTITAATNAPQQPNYAIVVAVCIARR